ncbi:hypothetical protein NE865_05141 [Phthorimaea operculella]|nr:hypothetical protein NE865_05141 [Phthorimaea operculella]
MYSQVQVQRPILPTTSKGKRKSEDSGRSQAKKPKKNIFSIIQAEESAVPEGPRNELSSFITKVSQGHTRRCTALAGDFYTELKVYKAEDIRNVPSDQRYKKALVSMKLYCNEGSKEWDCLQEFLGATNGMLVMFIRYSRSSMTMCQQKRPVMVNNFFYEAMTVSFIV